MIGKVIESIPKFADVIRKAFKDKSNKKISELELLTWAEKFDKEIELKWAQFETLKVKSDEEVKQLKLESEILQLKIDALRNQLPTEISNNLVIKLEDISRMQKGEDGNLLVLNNVPGKMHPFTHISDDDYDLLIKACPKLKIN